MKPFRPEADMTDDPCPKCRTVGAWTIRWVDYASGVYGDSGRDWHYPEHMEVRCLCGYSYEMAPADYNA